MVAGLAFVVLLAAFIWWENRAPSPMLDLDLFRSRVFAIGISTNFMSFLGITSARFLLPFYLQAALGYTPSAGRPGAAAERGEQDRDGSGPAGRLSDRYGWRLFNVAGLLLSAAGLFGACFHYRVVIYSSLALVGIVLHSAGSGLFQSPNSASIFSAADPRRHGVVAAFVNLTRNAGNVTGIAIAASIVTAVMVGQGFEPNIDAVLDAESGSRLIGSFMTGLKAAFLVMAVLQLIGAAASAFKKSAEPETATAGERAGVAGNSGLRDGADQPGQHPWVPNAFAGMTIGWCGNDDWVPPADIAQERGP